VARGSLMQYSGSLQVLRLSSAGALTAARSADLLRLVQSVLAATGLPSLRGKSSC
jgi:hypothetical protein